MSALAKALEGAALDNPEIEWTCEANPESLTLEVAHAWRSAGVNRISLGAQTWHPGALGWMGRTHGPDQVGTALRRAGRAGFSNFSVDLIFGLPERLGRSWREDLEKVLSLDVPHVSLYGLTVERGTPLGRAVANGEEHVASEDRYRDEYLYASERLTAEGYVHYEVSNFARPGYHSRHNAAYWTGEPYLGLGNSAHSFLPPLRRWNLREWEAYLNAVSRGLLPVKASEELSPDARRLERIWLGLRTAGGIRRSALPPRALNALDSWVLRGWAEESPERVRLTPPGWLILDRLAVDLDAACGA
jgi:oxygen-independent coproporphyrinogen-3 oxidase